MRKFGFFILSILASIGFMVVALSALGIYLASSFDPGNRAIATAPDKIILTLDLDKPLVEGSGGPRIEGFNLRRATTLQEAVIAIRKATEDSRVVAIKATLNTPPLGLAQSQEIRDAIAAFRASGKQAYLFSETMGEGQGALPTYYLASAFSEIWMQPSGTVGIAGIGTEGLFLKKFLERFGVKADFVGKGEYKSAPEMFTNTSMSPANREQTEALLQSWYTQMVEGIAADRKITVDEIKAMVNDGPQMAKDAQDSRLIDHLGYRDQFDAALKKQIPSDAQNVALNKYAALPLPDATAPVKNVALIHAIGEINRTGGPESPFSDNTGIHADKMVKAIRQAADDEDIAAVLLRVSSPGGSYVASDTIWREIVRAKEKGKPVIVSMGDTAASGGYFIAMHADRIFASPATVTGSIGVFTGKMVIGEALKKLDINTERIVLGDSAGMFSATTEFSPEDLARLNRQLDATYADFIGKAAQGRGKSVEDIDKVARGRVWSGTDAIGAGLVDETGGFLQALDYTKTKIGLKPTDRVTLVDMTGGSEAWWDIFKYLGAEEMPDDIENFFRAAAWFTKVVSPLMNQMARVENDGPQLYMAPMAIPAGHQ
jgi:protease-4